QEVAQASGRAAELPPAAPEEGEPETLADGIHPTAGPLLSDPPNLPGWTRWLESAPWVFGTGSSLVLGWLAVGAVHVVWLCRRSREAPAVLQTLLHKVVGATGQRPRLRLCPAIDQPVALGTVRPAILLPAHLVAQVPEVQLEAVLAHEWAHIRRGDLWLL